MTAIRLSKVASEIRSLLATSRNTLGPRATELEAVLADLRGGRIASQSELAARLEATGIAFEQCAQDAKTLRTLLKTEGRASVGSSSVLASSDARELAAASGLMTSQGGLTQRLARLFETAKDTYAAKLHNQWRRTKPLSDGRAADGRPLREPVWEPVASNEMATVFERVPGPFRRLEGDVYQVDVANLPFHMLPAGSRFEKAEAAKGAIEILEMAAIQHSGSGHVLIDIEKAASVLHEQWVARNSFAPGIQRLPYSRLSDAEWAQKQRAVIDTMRFVNQELISNGHAPMFFIL